MNVGSVGSVGINPIDQGRVARPPAQTLRPPESTMPVVDRQYSVFYNSDGDRADISGRALNQYRMELPGYGLYPMTEGSEIPGARLEALQPAGDCGTCANRKYVDKSSDSSVSFQAPGSISAGQSAATVAAHEREHLNNDRAKAHRDGDVVVNQSISLIYDCCPECGKSYVSGGSARTTVLSKTEMEIKVPGKSDNGNDQPGAA